MPTMKVTANADGTCDLILEYSRAEISAEFANELDVKETIKPNGKQLARTIASYAKRAKIKTVKILVSGVLVATVAFSSFMSALAATDRYTMGYLYTGTDIQQVEYVNQTNNALDTVSPSYFDIREDGSLKLNYLSPYFIKTMHDQGVKVVPFLSNHWNRTAGINALKDPEALATQIAEYVDEYNLDGVNVDIENVTHEQREQYTEFVRLLRQKIPSHKEISVAVAANPNNWQTGWHGSYDYAALAKYADHLLIMAYDEHYEGGEAGPVASINFVEKSIQYALSKTTPDKIVVGVPFFGRVWSTDSNRINGKGVSSATIQKILEDCQSTVTYDQKTQSVKAEFTITEADGKYTVGGDFVLQPGKYVVWFENDQSYQEKLGLIEKYDLKGAGAWALGQEDPSIWEHYESWVEGTGTSSEPSSPESGNGNQGNSGTEGNTGNSSGSGSNTGNSSGSGDSTGSGNTSGSTQPDSSRPHNPHTTLHHPQGQIRRQPLEDFPAISGFRKPLSGDYEAEQPEKHHHIYRYAAENSFCIGKYNRGNHFRRQYFNGRKLHRFRKHRKFLALCFLYPLHGKTGRHLMEHRQIPVGFGKPVYRNYETKRDEERFHLSRPGSQAAEITPSGAKAIPENSMQGFLIYLFRKKAAFPFPPFSGILYARIFISHACGEWEGSLCISKYGKPALQTRML